MEEIITDAAGGGVGQWLKLVLAVIAGLGGGTVILEIFKYLVSLPFHRRKDKAEAKKEEATAGQQDAELREKEITVLNKIVEAAKEQLDEFKQANVALKAEKEEDRRIKSELRMELAKVKRQCNGVQTTLSAEIAARRAAERLYCDNETCTLRHPPKGTYHSDEIPRNKLGQFVSRKKA